MQWSHPEAIYLILPLTLAWLGLSLYSERRKERARTDFAAQAMWPKLFPQQSLWRFWTKLALRIVAMISGLVALAGPQYGTEIEQVTPRGSDLYVLIDVSRSMLATDVTPSRLARAQADVSGLVNRLQGERIGLIAFAGQAVVKCPLTVDYDSFRRALQELDTNSAPRGGTAIGDAIRKALEVFQNNNQREQAILLITDGDDQQSYPLDAAAVAAERKVTIFTVGLGDPEQGARIPTKANSADFLEYQGQQVWSKLDGNLLSEIALKTAGVYIPAGTKAYDLGQLYADHLKDKRSNRGEAQSRERLSEQFQFFLAASLLLLLIDQAISRFAALQPTTWNADAVTNRRNSTSYQSAAQSTAPARVWLFAVALSGTNFGDCCLLADEPRRTLNEGLRLYSEQQYSQAQEKFAAAAEALDKIDAEAAAIAAFDEACALHRDGQFEKARDRYLKAGVSKDRQLAVNAHFNLGTMAAEQARALASPKPESVEPEKRQEIVDRLLQAAAAYRHCLELKTDHSPARRNLELVRTWIKHYSDRWRAMDRQKRRDESDLLQFLEFIVQSQASIRANAIATDATTSADRYAELALTQKELNEELPFLREKIESTLKPPVDGSTGTSHSAPPSTDSAAIDQSIRLLQGWVDAAAEKMQTSASRLAQRQGSAASELQQQAIQQLDQIWDAVVPFGQLLGKCLEMQTIIAGELKPYRDEPETESPSPDHKLDSDESTLEKLETDKSPPPEIASDTPAPNSPDPPLHSKNALGASTTLEEHRSVSKQTLAEWLDQQEASLKRTQLLAPKAEMELKAIEQQAANAAKQEPPSTSPAPSPAPNAGSPDEPPAMNPEQIRLGLEKAIELSPKAVDAMESSLRWLKDERLDRAALQAEEARRILEEILKAQPKPPQNPDQANPNQDKNSQDQNQSPKDPSEENNDPQKDEQDKSDQDKSKNSDDPSENKPEKKQPEKKEPDKKQPDKKSSDGKQNAADQSPKEAGHSDSKPESVSADRIEEALRKVRERQQEKRDRDRQMRLRAVGRVPVDKDW